MSNDFLPFAIDGGANVISQAAYDALAARDTGFVAGVAQSDQLNRVWRQGSVMAAAIGTVIDDAGLNALDDGNLPNLVLALKGAVVPSELAGGKSLTTNGYYTHPGGMVEQWGTIASLAGNSTVVEDFPIVFPTACLNVSVSCGNPTANSAPGYENYPQIVSFDDTAVTVFMQDTDPSTVPLPVYWRAIGH